IEDVAASPAVGRKADPGLVLADRLARARADRAVRLADRIAALQQLLLDFLALRAREPAVVGGPRGLDTALAAQAVRQQRDRERVRLRRVVRVHRVVVLEDEKRRTRRTGGQQQRSRTGAREGRAVDAPDSARAPRRQWLPARASGRS